MRLIAALFALTLCMARTALAENNESVYAGTIGKSAVTVRFYTNDDNKPAGIYFYNSSGRDILLFSQGQTGQYGECNDCCGYDTIHSCEAYSGPSGYWKLSMTNAAAVGTWSKTPDFKTTMPIRLKRAAQSCDDQRDAYECLRIEGPVSVVKGSQARSKDGEVAWHFVREKRSAVAIPQLTKAPDATAMNTVNKLLWKSFRGYIRDALGDYGTDYDGEKVITNEVVFANKRMMTVETSGGGNKKGRAFGVWWSSTTYDLVSGDEIDLREFIRLPAKNAVPFNYKKGKDIVSLALREANAKQNDPECYDLVESAFGCKGSICSKNDILFWGAFSPRQNGLYVKFFRGYGPADANCEDGMEQAFTIPWRKLQPLFLKPFPLQ